MRRYAEINGSERAATVAAKAFLALIPLVIVTGGLVPDSGRDVVADNLVHRFDLSGAGAEAVRLLFTTPADVPGGFTAPAVVLLLFSGLSLVRALQRTWEVAWDLPRRGLRGTGWAVLATGVLLLDLVLLNLVSTVVSGLPGDWYLMLPLRLGVAVVFWLVVQHLLLGRRVPWRDLRPGALTSAAGQVLLTAASALYVPGLVDRYAARYGVIGVTFVLVSWLVVLALVLVAGAVLSAELHRRHPSAPSTVEVS